MSQFCRSFFNFIFSVKVSLLISLYKYLFSLYVNSKPHPKIMLHQLDQNNSIFGNLLSTHSFISGIFPAIIQQFLFVQIFFFYHARSIPTSFISVIFYSQYFNKLLLVKIFFFYHASSIPTLLNFVLFLSRNSPTPFPSIFLFDQHIFDTHIFYSTRSIPTLFICKIFFFTSFIPRVQFLHHSIIFDYFFSFFCHTNKFFPSK